MAPIDKEAFDLTAETDKKKELEAKKKKGGKKGDEIIEDTLSEEDQELKQRLEDCVSTLANAKDEVNVTVPLRQQALDMIVMELRTATASMTSVPKPLKFLRPHFSAIKTVHSAIKDSVDNETLELRARLADVLSVLAMTMGKPGE
jgi:26S proteasome regulatory subunit N1